MVSAAASGIAIASASLCLFVDNGALCAVLGIAGFMVNLRCVIGRIRVNGLMKKVFKESHLTLEEYKAAPGSDYEASKWMANTLKTMWQRYVDDILDKFWQYPVIMALSFVFILLLSLRLLHEFYAIHLGMEDEAEVMRLTSACSGLLIGYNVVVLMIHILDSSRNVTDRNGVAEKVATDVQNYFLDRATQAEENQFFGMGTAATQAEENYFLDTVTQAKENYSLDTVTQAKENYFFGMGTVVTPAEENYFLDMGTQTEENYFLDMATQAEENYFFLHGDCGDTGQGKLFLDMGTQTEENYFLDMGTQTEENYFLDMATQTKESFFLDMGTQTEENYFLDMATQTEENYFFGMVTQTEENYFL